MWRWSAGPSSRLPCLRRNRRYVSTAAAPAEPSRPLPWPRPHREWPSSENALYDGFPTVLMRAVRLPAGPLIDDRFLSPIHPCLEAGDFRRRRREPFADDRPAVALHLALGTPRSPAAA